LVFGLALITKGFLPKDGLNLQTITEEITEKKPQQSVVVFITRGV
jgi:hypothetical protein